MTTGTTPLLELALPVEGELDGQWGDVVNYAITSYVDIAVAGTLTLNGDGAVELLRTTGDDSGTNIGATTAQYAIIKITGTLTTTKIITAPSVSKTYIVDNAATGGAVTFKASGQAGVSVAVGEKCTVYYNGSDYVKVASSVVDGVSTFSGGTTGLTPSTATSGAVTLAGTLAIANGGTGTATPALVAGSNVTITGTWPNQTIAASAPGTGTVTSVAGTGSANGLSLSGTVTSTGNITLGGAVTSLTTTNFTIEESGGNLVFKYGATVIASMDSSGNLTTLANVTAYGTP